MYAALEGRAIEIAGGVWDEAAIGNSPVRAAAKAVQHRLRPPSTFSRRQLEYRSQAMDAASVCGAVENAGAIEDKSSVWFCPVPAAKFLLLGMTFGAVAAGIAADDQ